MRRAAIVLTQVLAFSLVGFMLASLLVSRALALSSASTVYWHNDAQASCQNCVRTLDVDAWPSSQTDPKLIASVIGDPGCDLHGGLWQEGHSFSYTSGGDWFLRVELPVESGYCDSTVFVHS